jgi:geranylgeranyl reductase family protein
MDVIVVGAGPAGAMAAKAVAESGYSVTVYEKDLLKREKPCGGSVSGRTIKEFNLNPEDAFWERACKGLFLCSPQNKTATLTSDDTLIYLVMREKFDSYLVEKTQKEGATFVEDMYVEPYIKNGVVSGVKTTNEVHESDIVIACDGTPSSFARTLKVYTGNGYNQAATYQYQMEMDNAEIDEKIGDFQETYFGHKWVPCGFAWVFPKKGIVTVGCGTWLHALKKYNINVKHCLDTFIQKHPIASQKLKTAKVLYSQSAMIGFSGIATPLYLDNFMIAGDAAGFVSITTGEGIYYSMVSGQIAGTVAAEALQAKDTSRTMLKRYQKRTYKKIGAELKWGKWLRRLALDSDKGQEKLIKTFAEDKTLSKKVTDIVFGDIQYDKFLMSYFLRPVNFLKFLLR